jgi:hypothetical protein
VNTRLASGFRPVANTHVYANIPGILGCKHKAVRRSALLAPIMDKTPTEYCPSTHDLQLWAVHACLPPYYLYDALPLFFVAQVRDVLLLLPSSYQRWGYARLRIQSPRTLRLLRSVSKPRKGIALAPTRRCQTRAKPPGGYLPFRPPPGRCASALPAAVFDAFEVRPSRSTFDAAFAAFLPVTLLLLLRATVITSFVAL